MGLFNYIKRAIKPARQSEVEQPDKHPQRSNVLAKVEMYSTPMCPYCIRAKALLNQKGVSFEDTNVMINPAKRQEMMQRSGGRTVPQIFINGKSIGGCDEMFDLESYGELDEMLNTK